MAFASFKGDDFILETVVQPFLIPVAAAVIVALGFAGRFRHPRKTEEPRIASANTQREHLTAFAMWTYAIGNPGALVGGIGGVLVITAVLFPPWLQPLGRTGLEQSVGRGTFFGPPKRAVYAEYAHIDYGRLAFEVILIVAGAAVVWLILRAVASRVLAASRRSAPLLQQVQDIASRSIIQGFRRLAAERGCFPTDKTSDTEILEIYRRVAAAFRSVAESRDEQLTAGMLNFISWKFLQLNENMGRAMMLDHLDYEVEKYRSEGLRPDYRQELKVF
jgi:hypothetical protein